MAARKGRPYASDVVTGLFRRGRRPGRPLLPSGQFTFCPHRPALFQAGAPSTLPFLTHDFWSCLRRAPFWAARKGQKSRLRRGIPDFPRLNNPPLKRPRRGNCDSPSWRFPGCSTDDFPAAGAYAVTPRRTAWMRKQGYGAETQGGACPRPHLEKLGQEGGEISDLSISAPAGAGPCARRPRAGAYAGCQAPVVAHAALHQWEEPPISGTRGSGTRIFSPAAPGVCLLPERRHQPPGLLDGPSPWSISCHLLRAHRPGAHDINLVNPTLRLSDCWPSALPVPVVWNSGGYDRVDTLQGLEENPRSTCPT